MGPIAVLNFDQQRFVVARLAQDFSRQSGVREGFSSSPASCDWFCATIMLAFQAMIHGAVDRSAVEAEAETGSNKESSDSASE